MKRATEATGSVITRDQVRLVAQAAQLECGVGEDGRPTQPLAVVPLLDGDRLAGFEVRCGCGSAAIVECVYEAPAAPPPAATAPAAAHPAQEQSS